MNKEKEAGFMRMLVAHETELRAFLRTLLPSWELVDDVLQEASVVMWNKLDQLENEEGFVPWAKVIVRFKAMHARRSVVRDRLVLSEETVALLAEDTPDSNSERIHFERRALDSCLQKLSLENRRLVLMPYERSGALSELAQRTDRSVNSLYKLLGRLREKLRLCVEQELITKGGES